MSGALKKASGAFTGTGANIDINCGFRPGVVEIVNKTGLVTAKWFAPMADASCSKRVTNGTMTFPTTGGITPQVEGFRVGTDTDINVNGELCYWLAEELPRQG